MVAALFLCGVTSAQNWGTPDSHAKSSNTPIVAKVTLGETVQEAGTLGAFVGDECRGKVELSGLGITLLDIYGRSAGESVTLKCYDAAKGLMYTIPDAVKM